MQRKLPPMVYLGGTTFTVDVTSAVAVKPEVIEKMKTAIASGLRDDARPFVPVAPPLGDADAAITCDITSLSSSSRVDTRSSSDYEKTGSHTVHDDATNTDQSVDDYGWVSHDYDVTVVDGHLTISYKVTDPKTGATLDSAALTSSYGNEFQGRFPGSYDPAPDLVSDAAKQILARLAPKPDKRVVLLPKGNLKDIGKLFASGSWNLALAKLQAMPAPKKPADDSYRVYLIGVINECMGYAASDPAQSTSFLASAVDDYSRAAQTNPKEKVFGSAKSSAEAALKQYETLISQIQALEQRRGALAAASPATQTASPQPAGASRPTLTNNAVIEMVKSGISEPQILLEIKGSKYNSFDTSPVGLYQLSQQSVDIKIVDAMKRNNRPQLNQGSGNRGRTAAAVLLMLAHLAPLLIR